MAESASAETLALLERLSNKPGVRSTLIISRTTGAIVQSSGFSNPDQAALDGEDRYSQTTTSEGDSASVSQQAERVAKAVFSFVKAAETCSQELSGDDDVRFLRLRLKRQELMIVPNLKFLLIVAHDTT